MVVLLSPLSKGSAACAPDPAPRWHRDVLPSSSLQSKPFGRAEPTSLLTSSPLDKSQPGGKPHVLPRSVLHSCLAAGRPHGIGLLKTWPPPHGQLVANAIMLVRHTQSVSLRWWLTCSSDHFHPGRKVALPTAPPSEFTTSSCPVPPSNGRVSSGESRLLRTSPDMDLSFRFPIGRYISSTLRTSRLRNRIGPSQSWARRSASSAVSGRSELDIASS